MDVWFNELVGGDDGVARQGEGGVYAAHCEERGELEGVGAWPSTFALGEGEGRKCSGVMVGVALDCGELRGCRRCWGRRDHASAVLRVTLGWEVGGLDAASHDIGNEGYFDRLSMLPDCNIH